MTLATALAVFVFLSPFSMLSTASANGDGDGITGYELDNGNSQFRAYLNDSCSFSLEGFYQLKYKSTITDTISPNKLSSLTGVSVKVLFLWLDIIEVIQSGDNLEFSVGIASATFPIDNFYECSQCGCGLDCVNDGQEKMQLCLINLGRNSVVLIAHMGVITLRPTSQFIRIQILLDEVVPPAGLFSNTSLQNDKTDIDLRSTFAIWLPKRE
ncbi:hypothetical protein ACFX13_032620 [Malus domestica]